MYFIFFIFLTRSISCKDLTKNSQIKFCSIPFYVVYTTGIARNDWSYNRFTMGAYSNPVIGIYEVVCKALQAPVGKKL